MPLSADSHLYPAIRDIVNAAAGANPFEAVKAVLSDYTNRFHALGGLVHEEDDDELLLHASPKLTIYHITLSPGVQYPPHNHLMDALIGLYCGGESNFTPFSTSCLQKASTSFTSNPRWSMARPAVGAGDAA